MSFQNGSNKQKCPPQKSSGCLRAERHAKGPRSTTTLPAYQVQAACWMARGFSRCKKPAGRSANRGSRTLTIDGSPTPTPERWSCKQAAREKNATKSAESAQPRGDPVRKYSRRTNQEATTSCRLEASQVRQVLSASGAVRSCSRNNPGTTPSLVARRSLSQVVLSEPR